jgi:large subunit ribosomal protein L25
MDTVSITVERRAGVGKGVARKLRAAGRVPAVVYGAKRDAASLISVSAEEVQRRMVHLEGTHLLRLVASGDGVTDLNDRMVLLRELQLHPVSGRPIHVDFYEVDLTERLIVSVTLHFLGKPTGVVNGGILQPILREVDVECLPTEIPEYLEVDVAPLDIHDAIHVGDLKLPPGVTPVGDPTRTVVTVLPPTVETGAREAAAAEAAPVAEGAGTEPAKKSEG